MPRLNRTGWDRGRWDDEADRVEFRYYDFICVLQRREFDGCWGGYVGAPEGWPGASDKNDPGPVALYRDEEKPKQWVYVFWISDDTPHRNLGIGDYMSSDDAMSELEQIASRMHFANPARRIRLSGIHPAVFVDCERTDLVTMRAPFPEARVGERAVPIYGPVYEVDFSDPLQVAEYHRIDAEARGLQPIWFQEVSDAVAESLREIMEGLKK